MTTKNAQNCLHLSNIFHNLVNSVYSFTYGTVVLVNTNLLILYFCFMITWDQVILVQLAAHTFVLVACKLFSIDYCKMF